MGYVSEAQGHIQELYELLLGTDEEAMARSSYNRKPPTKEELILNSEDFLASSFGEISSAQLAEKRLRKARRILSVITVLESFEAKVLKAQFVEWLPHAIDFLQKSPSARDRHRFKDEEDRTLFLCSCLWHARLALAWLKDREFEGLLRGGLGYRAQTAQAAQSASIHPARDGNRPLSLFPFDNDASEGLTTSAERQRYAKWSYDPRNEVD